MSNRLPIVTKNSDLEELGMRLSATVVSETLGHIFRDKRNRDIGIDAELELVEDDKQSTVRNGTGRLIALQIKCGLSFFKETQGQAYVFRGELKHLDYWIGHSLPVIILICHPLKHIVYWVEVTPGAIIQRKKGWKILIPKANTFDKAQWEIKAIARRHSVDATLDLCIQAWVHARHRQRVEFAGGLGMPRDYHWYNHLIRIGDEQVMLHWLYARYGVFEIEELREVIRLLPGNMVYGSKLILGLVAESEESFCFYDDWLDLATGVPNLECVRLIFDRCAPAIYELHPDGCMTLEYFDGEPIHSEPAGWASMQSRYA